MQQKRLWPKAYLNLPVDETTSSEAIDRRKKIDQYRQMRAQGLPEDLALEFIGWSRAKYYRLQSLFEKQGLKGLAPKSRRPHKVRPRQWSREEEQQVLALRREHPVWGKAILTRDHGLTLSESTVGRILSKAIRLNWIKPCVWVQIDVSLFSHEKSDNEAADNLQKARRQLFKLIHERDRKRV